MTDRAGVRSVIKVGVRIESTGPTSGRHARPASEIAWQVMKGGGIETETLKTFPTPAAAERWVDIHFPPGG